jgi:hypothetical protein
VADRCHVSVLIFGAFHYEGIRWYGLLVVRSALPLHAFVGTQEVRWPETSRFRYLSIP